MCGIFGVLTRGSRETERVDLREALRTLRHRGPDDEGTFEGRVGDLRCELALTRLAIMDRSAAGHQPMRSSDGRYVIVYNGAVENHSEIRRELEESGVRFRSTSDTEAVVEAFARWGPRALERMRGMFAFGIWDTRLGHLFLARDRLGIKPLYFTTRGASEIAFASEIRTLMATGTARRKISKRGLAGYLQWGSVPEPDTILEDVQALPAGAYLTVQDGQFSLTRYWEARLSIPTCQTFEEAVEQVSPLLKEAVSLGLVADVPVGVFLSGGIDSSVITALAANAARRPLDTFTVAFDPTSTDEAKYARTVATRFGCNHHEVHLEPKNLSTEIDVALGALDQPSADGINTFFVSKAVAARGISVVLSGLGADELFAGYDLFREFGAARRMAGFFPTSTASGLDAMARAVPILANRSAKIAGLLTARHTGFGAYSALRCMFTPAQARSLLGDAAVTSPDGTDGIHDRDAINSYSVFELTNYVPNTLLRDADVMSMAHALEVRVPLLDYRLVEQLLAIPGHLKMGRGTNKPLLVASAPELPSEITHRSKVGFTLPWDNWLRGPLQLRVGGLLERSSVEAMGLLQSDEVVRLWRSFSSRDRHVTGTRIWCIAALLAWCDQNRVTM